MRVSFYLSISKFTILKFICRKDIVYQTPISVKSEDEQKECSIISGIIFFQQMMMQDTSWYSITSKTKFISGDIREEI